VVLMCRYSLPVTPQNEGAYVCLWHLADVQTALMNVRFEGNNGHDAYVTRCLLMTQNRHCERQAFTAWPACMDLR